jgi:hypothetical protein
VCVDTIEQLYSTRTRCSTSCACEAKSTCTHRAHSVCATTCAVNVDHVHSTTGQKYTHTTVGRRERKLCVSTRVRMCNIGALNSHIDAHTHTHKEVTCVCACVGGSGCNRQGHTPTNARLHTIILFIPSFCTVCTPAHSAHIHLHQFTCAYTLSLRHYRMAAHVRFVCVLLQNVI